MEDIKWIRKAEKLPSITQGFFDCLIFRNDKSIRQARFGYKNQRFLDMQFEDIDESVTHWMPLPEKPQP